MASFEWPSSIGGAVPITRNINTAPPLTGGGPLSSDLTLGITQATTSTNGYLSSTDWNSFNSKQAALTIGNITDAGTDGITITGGTGAIIGSGVTVAQHVADSTHNGYLLSTDWVAFNAKQAAGNYITALTGDGTASGPGSVALTLATVNSNVGSFILSSITVNGKGLITAASSAASGNLTDAGTDGITITGGTGAILGSGTSIAQHVSDASHNGYLSSTDWSTFNGKQASGNYITALTGDGTAFGPGSAALTLATVNSNIGSFNISNITVNGKGLVTAASAASTTGSGSVVLATSPTITTPTIAALPNLSTNGFVKTGGGVGTLSIDTSTYITGNQTITLSGDITGSGTTAITTTYNGTVPLNKGGTGTAAASANAAFNALSPLTTKGDVLGFSTVNARLGVGSDGAVLTADAASTLGFKWAAAGAGTVTSVSVASANGFAGTVATSTTTPAITISTSITGILQGNGTAISAVTSTGSGNNVLTTAPTISQPVINGVTDGSAAGAGVVGEVLSQSRVLSAETSITTATTTNVVVGSPTGALALTAGDWDIWGTVVFDPQGTTVITRAIGGISKTSATLPATDTKGVGTSGEIFIEQDFPSGYVPAGNITINIPIITVSLSGTTNFYLVARTIFSVSTNQVLGQIIARRRR